MALGSTITNESSSYHVHLDEFDGPLDLLLQLIESQTLDITTIAIAKITDQYLSYLDALETFDLETASEFLVIAATLLELKARMLLPAPRADEPEECKASDEMCATSEEELLKRLREYKQFKAASNWLRKKEESSIMEFAAPVRYELRQFQVEAVNRDPQDILQLASLMQACLKKQLQNRIREIPKQRPTIYRMMAFIKSKLTASSKITSLRQIFPKAPKRIIIAAFLALLELAKRGEIKIDQAVSNDILISSKRGDAR